jgi:hypothetical protein
VAVDWFDRVVAAGITKQFRTTLGDKRLVRINIIDIGSCCIGHISILAREIGENVVK